MWFFSWFKHDPSKDEIAKAKKESLKLAEQEEEKMKRLEKSKKKGKTKQVDDGDHVEDKGQVKPSKDHVEKEDLNPLPSICYGCNSAIEDGIHVDAFDVLWHPLCLICLHCQQPIDKKEISNSKGQYHRPCYHICYVCEKKIEKGIKYNRHPFWKEKYCPGHDDDGTAKCCSCERLESFGTKYVNLEDGRWLCRECMECAVMDTVECQNLHSEILEFFEGLNMKIKKKFPLLLVEKEALNKAEKEEKIDHQSEVITRGICLSEEQIVTSVSKLPKEVVNNRLIGMARESQRVVRECEVTAILILYGLPRFLTGYILAHEMMHAWLRLNGYRNLNTVLEEGLCQVLGHMWLEPQTYATSDVVAAAETADASSSSSPSRTPPATTTSKKCDPSVFEKKLVEFCKYQIETDDSPVYGLGFKKVCLMMKSNNYSLKDTLKEIVKTISDSKF